jgi:transcriptional regulator with XRE-family HTH domain
MEFTDWLTQELNKREWSPAELAERAGLSKGAISHVFSGTRKPGVEFARAIAQALKLPEETVFRAAGLLTTPPDEDPVIAEITHLARILDPDDVQDLIDMARLKIHRYERILKMVKRT